MKFHILAARTGCALLFGAAVLIAPVAAHADPPPPCYGSSCNGKDPRALGCDGVGNSEYLGSVPVNGGQQTLYLRYSYWCHSNWALLVTPNINLGANFWVVNTYGDRYDAVGVDYQNSWTAMVNGVPEAQACVVDNRQYPPSSPGCTAWY